ncbi:hypothetical protein L202_03240 [Cryptococcus amylolentus CBS 6039]|uniref:Uncharacterized protein n=1 Tax=Cryptococcus amylolentus CBS 6039 TaxID=1295533 RepID=A0A1E3HXU6_9TREE|nr:hypothetical protein L202_03240 [Cryptococcus amylolentus CBS 6039]ODN81148.1 hypothetical protein L202_03240 [Cryptococcus amylolentus CBS 6039]
MSFNIGPLGPHPSSRRDSPLIRETHFDEDDRPYYDDDDDDVLAEVESRRDRRTLTQSGARSDAYPIEIRRYSSHQSQNPESGIGSRAPETQRERFKDTAPTSYAQNTQLQSRTRLDG